MNFQDYDRLRNMSVGEDPKSGRITPYDRLNSYWLLEIIFLRISVICNTSNIKYEYLF
jgi:hypothetical protein